MIEQEQWNEAIKSMETYKRKRALKALFEPKSIDACITDLNYIQRGFCWFKTLMCLLFNRTYGSYLDSNKFCILSYDLTHGYESQSWDSCWVSTYLFKDWNVCLCGDGT